MSVGQHAWLLLKLNRTLTSPPTLPCRYQVQREITLHLQLEHENVIQLYAAWEDDQAVYLVQELARGGDLFKEVKKRDSEEPADESLVVQNYMYPFLSALKYLHGKVRGKQRRRRTCKGQLPLNRLHC